LSEFILSDEFSKLAVEGRSILTDDGEVPNAGVSGTMRRISIPEDRQEHRIARRSINFRVPR